MARLLEARARRQTEWYRHRLPQRGSVEKRLAALAAARTEEGYMAEALAQADGTWLLVENHCPICTAARLCQGLCGGELQLFQNLLGDKVSVERTEHIIAGARRCAYLVRRLDRKVRVQPIR
jgi:predicted ArsR family transcriptional regulator